MKNLSSTVPFVRKLCVEIYLLYSGWFLTKSNQIKDKLASL